ncbi:unnamed protein product [Rotaria sp. Silwood1]|nr:unnamed protein product [Rotaria sp. Silwood1]
MAFLSIIVLTILRLRLAKDNKKFKKEYIALLINPNKMIEMMIPINEQRQKPIGQYAIPIQTETFYPCIETNQDYYQSILSTNDIPYYPVRETIFQSYPKSTHQIIADINEDNYSDEHDTKFI